MKKCKQTEAVKEHKTTKLKVHTLNMRLVCLSVMSGSVVLNRNSTAHNKVNVVSDFVLHWNEGGMEIKRR